MYEKQIEINSLIRQGREIESYIGKEVLKEGSPVIILKGYEWLREVMSLLAKNINLFGSCLTLLENNMEQEAYILARSQFNNTLWINYLCGDSENKRTKEFFYEFHISQLLQFRNIRKYITENEEKIKKSGAELIDKEELNVKIGQIEKLLVEEGYNINKLYSKSIAQLAKKKPELLVVYISMYCEGSKYEHSNRSIVEKFRKEISDEYDVDTVFKLDLGSSDFEVWKQVFNFTMSDVFYALNSLYERINHQDKHLFEKNMLSDQAIGKSIMMIKTLTDKLDFLYL